MNTAYINYMIDEYKKRNIKKAARKRLDYYEDDWKEYLESLIEELYPRTYHKLTPKIATDINLLKFYVDEVVDGGMYSNGVVRNAYVNNNIIDTYDEYKSDDKVDMIMENAYRYALAVGGVVIESYMYEGKLHRRLHHLDNVDLVFHPVSNQLISVKYYTDLYLPEDFGSSNQYINGHTYTKAFQYSLTDEGVLYQEYEQGIHYSNKVIKSEILPIKYLPFYYLDFGKTSNNYPIDLRIGQDLIDAQTVLARRMLSLDHTDDFNSWVQVVLNKPFNVNLKKNDGKNISEDEGITMSPDTVHIAEIDQNGNGGIDIIDLNSPQMERLEVAMKRVEYVLNAYGISFDNSKSAESGFKLLVSNRKLNERRQRHIKYLENAEDYLFEVEKDIINTYGLRKIDINSDLVLEYDDLETVYTVDEIKARQEHEFEYGLSHPIRVIAQERGISLDEAEGIYKENITWKQKYQSVNPFEQSIPVGDDE